MRVIFCRHESFDLAIAIHAMQTAAKTAEPDVAIPGGGDCPDIVATHGGMGAFSKMRKIIALGVQATNAMSFNGQPELIPTIHMQGLDHIPRQCIFVTRGVAECLVTNSVITRQAILAGDPQIAFPILGNRV